MSESKLNDLEILEIEQIRQARFQLWHMGILEWKFSITQQKIFEFYKSREEKTIVINCSRRLGKTFLLTLMAIEQCLKNENSVVKFLMPEVKMIRTTLRPIMNEIFQDAPKELIPKFNTQDSIYKFNNGSEIHLAGSDNGNYDKLRGGSCELAIVDEAGFCSDLNHIIKYILTPTTLLTRGKIILSSTTPPKPDHEFIDIMDAAEIKGTLIRKTIFDARDDDKGAVNPRITDEIIADIIKDDPLGAESDSFRTEFLCQKIFNSSDSVFPEFTEEVQKQTICEWPKPSFYDRYVSMDIGFVDMTIALFGYWDFDNGVLVIEDEIILAGQEVTSRRLAEKIIQKEHLLWTNKLTGEFEKPYARVSDNNLILINDLHREHGLYFQPTDKHNKDAHIGKVRNMIQNNQLIINPRCKTLISHMKNATWDKKKGNNRSFRRSSEGHHYDGCDAILYMCRNIDTTRNPYPKGYNFSKLSRQHGTDNVFQNPYSKVDNNTFEDFEKMFTRRSSLGKKSQE
jgi:hypothetical protein